MGWFSLREAFQAVAPNTNARIILGEDQDYVLDCALGELVGAAGSNIFIQGHHSTISYDGEKCGRVINHLAGNDLAVTSLTIRDGWVKGHGGGVAVGGNFRAFWCEFENNVAFRKKGGAIYAGSTIDLIDCKVTGNHAEWGTALYSDEGIWLDTTEIRDEVYTSIAAIYTYGPLMIKNNSVVEAGGINHGSSLTMDNSLVRTSGFKIINDEADPSHNYQVHISNSALINDLGQRTKFAVQLKKSKRGAQNVRLVNSTVAGYSARGIDAKGAWLRVEESTVVDNKNNVRANTLTLRNSILAHTGGAEKNARRGKDCDFKKFGPISASYSVASDDTCDLLGIDNQYGTGNQEDLGYLDLGQLDTFQRIGGSGRTAGFQPASGSVFDNTGICSPISLLDQRFADRAAFGCDIGAIAIG